VCAPNLLSLSLKVASLRILTPCVPFYFNGVYPPLTPKALTCRPSIGASIHWPLWVYIYNPAAVGPPLQGLDPSSIQQQPRTLLN
jgi:hypothetical protein